MTRYEPSDPKYVGDSSADGVATVPGEDTVGEVAPDVGRTLLEPIRVVPVSFPSTCTKIPPPANESHSHFAE